MSRNVRTNFLTDKATFGNSTMPIGSIVPIFKATDDKVTDNGVVHVIDMILEPAPDTTNVMDIMKRKSAAGAASDFSLTCC